MDHYRLPVHLGLCEVDDRLLMLDLRRDRYFQIDPASTASLGQWRDNRLEEGEDLMRLLDRGLLVPSDRPTKSGWTEHLVPHRSLLDTSAPSAPASVLTLPELALTFWRARRSLKRGLEHSVDEMRRRKVPEPAGDALASVARFRAARRWIPVASNCLTDSIALAAFLARRSVRADLVFGVKLDPFAAHCWLQTDEVILNDAVDIVTSFTPILVV